MAGKGIVAWLAAFGGAGLVWAALHDVRPIEAVKAALGGGTSTAGFGPILAQSSLFGAAAGAAPVDTDTDPTADSAGGTSSLVNTGSGSSASGGPVEQSRTVVAGPNVRLVPAAAAAFTAWQASFGQTIPCSSGWRSAATQSAGYNADPKRFASAATSFHTAGKAVDVDNNWLNKLSAAQQSRLRQTAKATGWRQARWGGEATCGSNTSNDNEPWHFSYGGCG